MDRMAQMLIDNKMVPKHLDTPAKVICCFITGRELGIGPVASTRQIYPAGEGKTGLMASLMRALCYKNIKGFELQILQTTDKLCQGRARRGGGEWTTVTFTWDDAVRAGLTGKGVWGKYPKAQLVARVSSTLCNIVGSDALLGCLTPEEYGRDEVADKENTNPVTVNGTVQEDGTDE